MKSKKLYQPVIEDNGREIRKKIARMSRETKLLRSKVAENALRIGLEHMEAGLESVYEK